MKVLKSQLIFSFKFYILSAILTFAFIFFEPSDFGISPYAVGVLAFVWNLFGVLLCVLNPGWLFIFKLDRRAEVPFSIVLIGGLSSNLIFLCATTIFLKTLGKPVCLHYIKLALLIFWIIAVIMPPINLAHKRVEFKKQSLVGVVAALVFISIVIAVRPYRAAVARGEERVISIEDDVNLKPCFEGNILEFYGFKKFGYELISDSGEGVVCVGGEEVCIDGVVISERNSKIYAIDAFSFRTWTIEIPEEVVVTTQFPGFPKENWRFPLYTYYYPKTFRFELPQLIEAPKTRCIKFVVYPHADKLILILGKGLIGERTKYLKRSFWLVSGGEMVDWFFNLHDQRRAFAPTLNLQYYSQPFWGFYITSIVREVTNSRVWGSQLFIVLLFAIFLAICIEACKSSIFEFAIFYIGLAVWFVNLLIYFWMNPTVQFDVVLASFSFFSLVSLLYNRPMEFVLSSIVAAGNRVVGPFVPFFIGLGYMLYDGNYKNVIRRFLAPYIICVCAVFFTYFGYLAVRGEALGVVKLFWFEAFPEHFFKKISRLQAFLNAFVNFNTTTFGIWFLVLFIFGRSLLLLLPLCALYLPVLLFVNVPHFRYYLPFAMAFGYVIARFGQEKKSFGPIALAWGIIMLATSFIIVLRYDIHFYLLGEPHG